MEPLEVFAVDENMNRATGSIPYDSLIWSRKYYECGEFSMVIPSTVYDPSWRLIVCDERPETGIIQKVVYTDDHTYGNSDTVEVSGFFLESIMNRRTFLDETPEEVTRRYYVSPPDPPKKSTFKTPTVYTDADGRYWYSTPSGSTYGVYDGTPSDSDARIPGSSVHTDETGQAYIQTGSGRVDVEQESVTMERNSYYFTSGSNTTINQTVYSQSESGLINYGTVQHDIAFDDGFGTTYYHNANGLVAATGVTKQQSDQYVVQKSIWDRTTDNGWVTYTETVAGPWQTTSVEDMTTEMDNVLRVWQWARMYFQNQMLFVEPDFTGETKIVDPSFELLGDLLYSELQTVEASFRVEYDFQNNQFTFRVWKGIDRTQAQSVNPWAVFSDTWGSLYGYTGTWDDSNYRNKCYILYEYEQPSSFDSSGRPSVRARYDVTENGQRGEQTGWYVPYTTKRGYLTVRLDDDYDDRETYLDLRGDAPACDSDWERDEYDIDDYPSAPALPAMESQYANYPASLEEQGKALLNNDYGIVTSLDTGDLRTDRYLTDYDLGDKVDMMVDTLGMVQEARIIGVEEAYEAGKATISIEIGTPQLDIIKKARLK